MEIPPGATWHLEVFITMLFSGYLMLDIERYMVDCIVQHPASSIRILGNKDVRK
jgi:hypothetical protein